jgi:DNA mismatch endonuclease (patch repair protein)
MSKISGKKTKPEIIIADLLVRLKYRFRQNDKTLPGTPDIVFSRRKKVIFVNGCFWHGHKKCSRSKLPTTNRVFWKDKIDGNIKRDKRNKRELTKLGWKYLVIWQCEINKLKEKKIIKKVKAYLEK